MINHWQDISTLAVKIVPCRMYFSDLDKQRSLHDGKNLKLMKQCQFTQFAQGIRKEIDIITE